MRASSINVNNAITEIEEWLQNESTINEILAACMMHLKLSSREGVNLISKAKDLFLEIYLSFARLVSSMIWQS
jgi:hypothetical protein